ncbi:MAG: hypothetical protein MI923_07305 [Phycisphaerales bacterium]|nr:hypothetical protein [Phycisphaerales bacterium]
MARRRPENVVVAMVLALPVLAGGCVTSTSSPLHPGQEATTGGRAGLSEWEYYDALNQMYQAQVMLNVIRLVEHGQAPLHFEFSNVKASITDTADIGSGFEFLDSPIGGKVIAGEFVGPGETNVKFTPSIGASRTVFLEAEAKPITRKNWVYKWYYKVADYFKKDGCRAFYEEVKFPHSLGKPWKEWFKGRLTIWYRTKLYVVREYYASGCEPSPLSPSPPVSPESELGALTAILSFLQKSDPDTATEAEIRVPATFALPIQPSGQSEAVQAIWGVSARTAKLFLDVKTKGAGLSESSWGRLRTHLNGIHPELKIRFPVKQGEAYSEHLLEFSHYHSFPSPQTLQELLRKEAIKNKLLKNEKILDDDLAILAREHPDYFIDSRQEKGRRKKLKQENSDAEDLVVGARERYLKTLSSELSDTFKEDVKQGISIRELLTDIEKEVDTSSADQIARVLFPEDEFDTQTRLWLCGGKQKPTQEELMQLVGREIWVFQLSEDSHPGDFSKLKEDIGSFQLLKNTEPYTVGIYLPVVAPTDVLGLSEAARRIAQQTTLAEELTDNQLLKLILDTLRQIDTAQSINISS